MEHTVTNHRQGSAVAPTVLVVDDDRAILDLVGPFLSQKGVLCTTAEDPREALEMIETTPIDVLVTDVHMDGVSGIDLLNRAMEVDPETPVILMTGRPTVESAVGSVRGDAYDYVTKPFGLEDLYTVVTEALERRRLERENTALKDTLALYRLTREIIAPTGLDTTLAMVLEMAQRELDSDRVALYLKGESGDLERWGDDERDRSEEAMQSRELAAEVFESGKPAIRHANGNRRDLTAVTVPIDGSDDHPAGALVARPRDSRHSLREGSFEVLLVLAGHAAAAIESERRWNSAIENRAGLVAANVATVGALVSALDARECETGTHSLRVTEYALRLAKEIGFPYDELSHLKFGAMLHDIGKIGIKDAILLKPGPLSEDEWSEMRRHPVIGYRILQNVTFLEPASRIVLHHHERFDGDGYPVGLSGEEIPLGARLFAVIDTYDAMTNNRPYRDAFSHGDAVDEIESEKGRQFDPHLVEAFLSVPRSEWDRIRSDVESYSHRWEDLSLRGGFKMLEAI